MGHCEAISNNPLIKAFMDMTANASSGVGTKQPPYQAAHKRKRMMKYDGRVGVIYTRDQSFFSGVMNRAELDGKFEKEALHRSAEGSRKMAF